LECGGSPISKIFCENKVHGYLHRVNKNWTTGVAGCYDNQSIHIWAPRLGLAPCKIAFLAQMSDVFSTIKHSVRLKLPRKVILPNYCLSHAESIFTQQRVPSAAWQHEVRTFSGFSHISKCVIFVAQFLHSRRSGPSTVALACSIDSSLTYFHRQILVTSTADASSTVAMYGGVRHL